MTAIVKAAGRLTDGGDPARPDLHGATPMLLTPWKKFKHPGGVYHLEYPAHWDQVQEDNGRSCGFGPHERNDVGLWISILPFSLDTEKFAEDMPRMMNETIGKIEAGPMSRDESIRHHALVSETRKEGEGGHYWLVCGGDVVLF